MFDPQTGREDDGTAPQSAPPQSSAPPRLSARGAARREAILDLARQAARARRRRRRVGGVAAAGIAAVVTIATAAAFFARRPPGQPVHPPVVQDDLSTPPRASQDDVPRDVTDHVTPEAPPGHVASESDDPRAKPSPDRPRPAVTVVRLSTEPGIAARLALRPAPGRQPVARLSDDELLERLAESGRPAGLAYVDGGGMTLLLFGDDRRHDYR